MLIPNPTAAGVGENINHQRTIIENTGHFIFRNHDT